MESVEGSRVVTKSGTPSAAALQRCCDLLGIDPRALCQCLTYRELQTMAPGAVIFMVLVVINGNPNGRNCVEKTRIYVLFETRFTCECTRYSVHLLFVCCSVVN